MQLKPGGRIGRYEIVQALGAGGMGEVYRARDSRLNRDVAIKALPGAFSMDDERVARFEREAQLLATLFESRVRLQAVSKRRMTKASSTATSNRPTSR